MDCLSILIVNYNSGFYTIKCIESILNTVKNIDLEFIVVDNNSPMDQKEYRDYARSLGAKWIENSWNAGYAWGVNRAYKESRGNLILLSNPDIYYHEKSIENLVKIVKQEKKIGAVGPLTYWDEGKQILFPPNMLPVLTDTLFQSLAHVFSSINKLYSYKRTEKALKVWLSKGNIELDMLSGGCMLFRRDVWDDIGEFDERFPLYYEDTDWFIRGRKKGYKFIHVKDATVTHFFNRSGVTESKKAMEKYWVSRRRFLKKYYGTIGEISAWFTFKLVHANWTKRFRIRPMDYIENLGKYKDVPLTLNLKRPCKRFILELTQDPGFFIAGAIFGSGNKWSPSKDTWDAFASSIYFLRGFDISGPKPRYLGTWSFERS